MLRTFVAVPLEEAARAGVAERLAVWRRAGQGGSLGPTVALRWVPVENLHLTVAFLGATAERLVPRIAEALAPVAARTAAPELRFDAAGAFPTAARPRVVWLGAPAEERWFGTLVRDVRAALAPLGFALDDGRPIRTHVTLARVGRLVDDGPAARRALGELLGRLERAVGEAPIGSHADRLVLYESRQVPGGVRYAALTEWPLGG